MSNLKVCWDWMVAQTMGIHFDGAVDLPLIYFWWCLQLLINDMEFMTHGQKTLIN